MEYNTSFKIVCLVYIASVWLCPYRIVDLVVSNTCILFVMIRSIAGPLIYTTFVCSRYNDYDFVSSTLFVIKLNSLKQFATAVVASGGPKPCGHTGGAVQHYCFDRKGIQALETRMKQYHALLATSWGGTNAERETMRLLEWIEVTACCAHDLQNALKWSLPLAHSKTNYESLLQIRHTPNMSWQLVVRKYYLINIQ